MGGVVDKNVLVLILANPNHDLTDLVVEVENILLLVIARRHDGDCLLAHSDDTPKKLAQVWLKSSLTDASNPPHGCCRWWKINYDRANNLARQWPCRSRCAEKRKRARPTCSSCSCGRKDI